MFRRIPSIPSRLDVVNCAAEYFSHEDGVFIMEILDQYGTANNEPHREFVQMTTIHYAESDADKLIAAVSEAKSDWHRFVWRVSMWKSAKAERDSGIDVSGWDLTPFIELPPSGDFTKEETSKLLNVHWKQIDEWVKEGEIKPCSTGPRNYRFAVEELERFQQMRFAVNIAEVWVKYQRGNNQITDEKPTEFER